MAHEKGISVVLIALPGCGFPTNPVTSKAAGQDTNPNVSKSLAKSAIKPTLFSKKFKEEQIKKFRENKLVEIKFKEKRINRENSNSQLGS